MIHEILEHTRHRPWPLPERPWLMRMTWRDLLFAHWPVRPEVLRPLVPQALDLQTFDGWAWLGITPLRMLDVRPRLAPPLVGLDFLELNVRTYVGMPGRSGVWFFSLDASSRLAVWAARRGFGLPYFRAALDAGREDGVVSFTSSRMHRGAARARVQARYRPVDGPPADDPLHRWLTERYSLYAVDRRGDLVSADIHHLPWPLQRADAEFPLLEMTEQLGFRLPEMEPVLHYAGHLDVVAWSARACASSRGDGSGGHSL